MNMHRSIAVACLLLVHETSVSAAKLPDVTDLAARVDRVTPGLMATHKTPGVSIALMRSPQGWVEPGQTPEFDEYTVVLSGRLHVETKSGSLDVRGGQGVIAHRGEWIRYSTPDPEGARYVAVCLPAFSPDSVHRDDA